MGGASDGTVAHLQCAKNTGRGGGTTGLLRTLLREQQRDCSTIRANPLFKEFRVTGQKKRGKGYEAQDAPPDIEDIETEGKMRTLELIKRAAETKGKNRVGVWAAFGKYECLGEPLHLDNKLPALNRDAMKANKRDSGKKSRNKAGASALNSKVSKWSNRRELTQAEHDRDKLTRHQTLLKFSNMERVEASFAINSVVRCQDRLARAKTPGGRFVNHVEADEDAADPEGVGIFASLAPLHRGGYCAPAETATCDSGADAQAESDHETSRVGTASGSNAPGTSAGAGDSSARGALAAADGQARWLDKERTEDLHRTDYYQPLTELVRPKLGDESNPVYKWHNDFVTVRQQGREDMQRMLTERAMGRRRTRRDLSLAAGFYASIVAEMEYGGGRRGGSLAPGKRPGDIWRKAEVFAQPVGGEKVGRPRNAHPVDLEDILLVERFYDQLCLLVETQKASDPISLLLVQTVKTLLERGYTLHAPLLSTLVDQLARFVLGAGMTRYNPYLLPCLTFIRKCCGVSDVDLDDQLEAARIIPLVYNNTLSPPVTPLRSASRPSSRAEAARPVSPGASGWASLAAGGSRPSSRSRGDSSGAQSSRGGL